MRAGKVAGVNVIFNNWFLLIVLIFILAGMTDKVCLVFSAVLWHEAAHLLTAKVLGYQVREVEVLPFGAVARVENLSEASSFNEIMIAAAGPLASFGLAALSYLGMKEFIFWRAALFFYCQVNLMLAGFNLIPALPLDGGRILRAFLSHKISYREATRAVVFLGYGIIALLMLWALLEYWRNNSLNLTVLVAAIFLYINSKTELKTAPFRLMRLMSGKKAALAAKNIMPTSHFTALASLPLGEAIRLFKSEEYNMVLVLDKDLNWQTTLTETQIWEALTEKGVAAKIGDV